MTICKFWVYEYFCPGSVCLKIIFPTKELSKLSPHLQEGHAQIQYSTCPEPLDPSDNVNVIISANLLGLDTVQCLFRDWFTQLFRQLSPLECVTETIYVTHIISVI